MSKLAVVLFNIGGPDKPEDIPPYLFNFFYDPEIMSIPMPSFIRRPLAKYISRRRAPVSTEIYSHMGGGSPLLLNTEAQGRALESALYEMLPPGDEARTFISMRYWHPRSDEAARAVADYDPDQIVLMPLYPQYSITTTGSSFGDWYEAARNEGITAPTRAVCCYPHDEGFISGIADSVIDALRENHGGNPIRVLFSAHGLPERTINGGDPYQWQVEVTYGAIVEELERRSDLPPFEPVLCYQSKVGPFKWIGPPTEAEIERAGKDGCSLVVVPIAFVSEHLETLVELDIEYAEIAERHNVPRFRRTPTVADGARFIVGMANMVVEATGRGQPVTSALGPRICPSGLSRCPLLLAAHAT